MPTYVYQVVREDGSGGETFEIVQRMSDPPLEKHPETGQPVRRIFLPPNLNTRGFSKRYTDPKVLERQGFTRYEKTGEGKYEKTAGSGPNLISRDS
ncbi:MAG: zinc ribbon domain-containing protein [Planctomycetes bacterium]|nr:zinc ribbon domain-containing protein [Planctomycetota bacterium]